MTPNDLFALAPELMKKWTATSLAIASSLEPTLVGLVERSSHPDWRAVLIQIVALYQWRPSIRAKAVVDAKLHSGDGLLDVNPWHSGTPKIVPASARLRVLKS